MAPNFKDKCHEIERYDDDDDDDDDDDADKEEEEEEEEKCVINDNGRC